MNNKIQNLLNIIKYTPILIVIIAVSFATYLIYSEQEKELKDEKKFIETQFINFEKNKIESKINAMHNYISGQKDILESELKLDIKKRINNIHRRAMNIYNKNKHQKTKEEIIFDIKTAIETSRFNEGRGYFSIHTIDGINILHPINKKFEGTNVLNRKDSSGNYPIQNAIEIAKTKKEGLFSWYYFKPNDKSKEFKKIGIVKKFEPYNLIITTAEYEDDFIKNAQRKILENIKAFNDKDKQYIFIVNFEGKIISHPSEKALSHNIFKEEKFLHIKDDFKELVESNKKDIGEFIIIKPKVVEGIDTKEQKITFVKRFDDWEWILSSSFRLSEVNSIIEKRKNILEEKYSRYKKEVLIYGIILMILLLILSYFMSKVLERKFLDYKENVEEQIKENKSQKNTLEKAQKIAKIGEYELDLETNIAHWSNSMIKLFGVEGSKEIPGPEFLKKIMYNEDWHCFETSIQKCMKDKVQHLCRYRIERPRDKKVLWIECRGELSEGNKLVGTVQDITQSKTLEIENQKKEELLFQQSKMAAMGEMLGNIAHQWRQPLSAISTAATGSKIQKEMNCLSDTQFSSAMDTINSSAQYLSETIDDFRNFFNPDNNKRNEFNISKTFSKTLQLISAQFTAKDIEVIQNIDDYKILSVENELIQVLINILNNARDVLVTKENQRRLIFINTYKKDDSLYIEIIDNAGGIKEDIMDRIFEPYFTTKHKSVGTGIGLYMSEEILHKHLNGNLSVSNEEYTYDGIKYTGAKFIINIL